MILMLLERLGAPLYADLPGLGTFEGAINANTLTYIRFCPTHALSFAARKLRVSVYSRGEGDRARTSSFWGVGP